jgi:hypothetical protein
MNNEENYFKYGKIIFRKRERFNDIFLNYTIIPYGYLAQEESNPENIYVFKTYTDMKNYFEGKKDG